jgi:regulatory protein
MVISEIKQLKNGRYGLFEAGRFVLSIDVDTYLESGICAGDELSDEQLEELTASAEKRKAADKALTLLTLRDHSGEELRRKLRRSVSDEAADSATEKMRDLGLIDDARFAQSLAEELYGRRYFGRRRVEYELSKRGVERGLAEETARSLDNDPEERAFKLITKKYPRGLATEADRRRAAALLERSGYGWEESRRALEQSENYDGTDEDAD